MLTKQQIISAIARPIRVAYLVDLDNSPHAALDAIFAEAYSRWGGRRTLIVPATADGIDPRYSEWLFYFDPDIIYSFVALSGTSVASLQERYAPAHLVRHRELQRDAERGFRIELPTAGLSSLSVLPVFVSRSWGFEGPPRNIKILSKYPDRSESSFLLENFGFLSTSFPYGAIGSAHPELYSTFTLISESALADRSLGKDPRATYVTSENEVLEALGAGGGPLTLAQLSEFFAPFLDPGLRIAPDGTCIVIGDTPSDRLAFWNIHHRFERPYFSEITSLRLPKAKAYDEAFLERLRQILRFRGVRGAHGRNDHIRLYSCSLTRDELNDIARLLQKGKMWLQVSVAPLPDHAAIVPRFRGGDWIPLKFGGFRLEPRAQKSAEFNGNCASIPLAYPWHMKEALPPADLRRGDWMLDLSIDREVDHSQYVNQRHEWRFPRRLRLDQAFQFEWEAERPLHLHRRSIRVVRPGLLSTSINVEITRASITIPDDYSAFRVAICGDRSQIPFVLDEQNSLFSRPRFSKAIYSDKGRYLTGVLQLFETIPNAFSVLMHTYWRDVLHYLGGIPNDSDEKRIQELVRVLRRRMGKKSGPLTFANEDQIFALAREALHAARMTARERRYIWYGQLLKRWMKLVREFVKAHPSTGGDGDLEAQIRDVRHLNESVQYLCQRRVLFQGREWRCYSCFNRNWVGIDDLSRTLVCSVCGRHEPAPVTGSWQFRLNPFILEAYKDHGTEAVIWSLWHLWERAQVSFYFVPSLWLWLTYPEAETDTCDVEVDAIAVVDGIVYLVEAKSSGGLTEKEIHQLVLAAERIRPDVVLLVCMDRKSVALDKSAEKLRASLQVDTKVEVLTFNPTELDREPFLPC